MFALKSDDGSKLYMNKKLTVEAVVVHGEFLVHVQLTAIIRFESEHVVSLLTDKHDATPARSKVIRLLEASPFRCGATVIHHVNEALLIRSFAVQVGHRLDNVLGFQIEDFLLETLRWFVLQSTRGHDSVT